jgi:hypothetical protein
MRRVITTTLYFDYEDVPDSSNVTEAPLKVYLPDISFSWFNGNVLAPLDTNGIDFFHSAAISQRENPIFH